MGDQCVSAHPCSHFGMPFNCDPGCSARGEYLGRPSALRASVCYSKKLGVLVDKGGGVFWRHRLLRTGLGRTLPQGGRWHRYGRSVSLRGPYTGLWFCWTWKNVG